jgi:predicted Rossmann-fold nucleotide-binding protein
VFGLLPGHERSAAATCVDVPLPTGLGPALATLVPLWADAAVAVGGGATTLAELSLFLHHGKPVVALQGSGGAAGVAASAWLDGRAPLLASDAADAVLSVLHALSSAPAAR